MKEPPAKAFEPMDEEERLLMEAHERGDYLPVTGKKLEYLQKLFLTAAKNTRKAREHVQKRQHISIKVPEDDLNLLKEEAEKQGLRYQSLINSILHQYITGRLKAV